MQIPGFHLYIEVIQNFSALPCSEFIPHPLTYVSTDSPFYPKVIVANNEETGHSFFLFVSGPSPSFTRLLEGLSVARITATDCSVNSTGCNIDVALTQSFKIPLRNEPKHIENPGSFFVLHPDYSMSCYCSFFCMLFTVIQPSIAHKFKSNYIDCNCTLYRLQMMRLNNVVPSWERSTQYMAESEVLVCTWSVCVFICLFV